MSSDYSTEYVVRASTWIALLPVVFNPLEVAKGRTYTDVNFINSHPYLGYRAFIGNLSVDFS